MKVYKSLDIKGATLDRYQLESYLKKIASEHVVKNSSDKNTYPIPNMRENFNIITETYRLLNKHIKLGIPIHAAGEWLLDNYYIIEENYKTIEKEMTLKKYKKLIGLSTGRYKGFARIYVLASEIVAYTDGNIDSETIELAISTYQEKKLLSMEEIWNIGVFLKIAINAFFCASPIYGSAEDFTFLLDATVSREVTPAAKQQVGETRKKRLAQRLAFFRFDNPFGV